jgi:predicted HicB family RNase H-like nuclease
LGIEYIRGYFAEQAGIFGNRPHDLRGAQLIDFALQFQHFFKVRHENHSPKAVYVMKEIVQFTARLPYETHRKLRFLAADLGISVNEALNRFLLEAMEGRHIVLPSDLQEPESN